MVSVTASLAARRATTGVPHAPTKRQPGSIGRPTALEELRKDIFPISSREWVEAAVPDQRGQANGKPPTIIIKRSTFSVKSVVASGAFGKIFLYANGRAEVALKIMQKGQTCPNTEDMFHRNSDIGKSFSQYLLYQKCIRFDGFAYTTVLMEKCVGDLNYLLPLIEDPSNSAQLLKQYGLNMWCLKLDILLKTLGAVFCLHERGYMYTDLKSANILYNVEVDKTAGNVYNIVPKLADLDGVCTSQTSTTTTFPPPEMWNGKMGTCDDPKLAWAIGVFIIEIMLNRKDSRMVTRGLWYKNVVRKGRDAVAMTDELKNSLAELRGMVPEDLEKLKGALNPDPMGRTTMDVIVRIILKYYQQERLY